MVRATITSERHKFKFYHNYKKKKILIKLHKIEDFWEIFLDLRGANSTLYLFPSISLIILVKF
jgi:hypothetical protein